MRKVAIPLAILALIGLDQWVKHWVVANIALTKSSKRVATVLFPHAPLKLATRKSLRMIVFILT